MRALGLLSSGSRPKGHSTHSNECINNYNINNKTNSMMLMKANVDSKQRINYTFLTILKNFYKYMKISMF